MNFTLTVSIGVTAKMASLIPAPKPHSIRLIGDRFPFSSTFRFFSSSKVPNLEKKFVDTRAKVHHPWNNTVKDR